MFAQHIDPQDRAMVQAAVQSALEQGSDYWPSSGFTAPMAAPALAARLAT
ncbi:MAG: hypothetical protein IPO19_12025 [Rhodoferax sp.]|nr:hypothetical protein [Rhodoferax sp.]